MRLGLAIMNSITATLCITGQPVGNLRAANWYNQQSDMLSVSLLCNLLMALTSVHRAFQSQSMLNCCHMHHHKCFECFSRHIACNAQCVVSWLHGSDRACNCSSMAAAVD